MKIHRIAVGPFGTNCVLVEDPATREALVVDPGGDRQAIEERIGLLDLKPVMIVHTHGHMDHCMESSALARKYQIPIAMHAADLPLYQNIGKQVDALLGPGASAGYGIETTVEPSVMLSDGDRVRVGELEAEVLHLPGHSPGGIGLLFRQTPPVLVSGDTLFRDGVGRTDLWGGDWETLLHSIRERIFTLPDDTKVVSGHGGDTTVGREKASFPY
jgi:glyoxylase-like metal-dependent hydrolase (beta-lactamase superfamily II)